jgi:hypothetical protein
MLNRWLSAYVYLLNFHVKETMRFVSVRYVTVSCFDEQEKADKQKKRLTPSFFVLSVEGGEEEEEGHLTGQDCTTSVGLTAGVTALEAEKKIY